MRKAAFLCVLIVAFLGFAAVALAQEASVFGDQVLVRAYLVPTPDSDPATYSAYLEVRDKDGVVLQPAEFIVTGMLGTSNPTVETNPFQIHFDDLTTPDISISYDSADKVIYVFCTDVPDGLHVMAYDIHLFSPDPVDGVCGTELNSCTVGSLNDTADSDTNYLWDCQGENGGNDAHCSKLKPINGACGTAVNSCTAGMLNDTADSDTNYLWDCVGLYDGTTAHCSAAIPAGSPDLRMTSFSGVTSGYEVGRPMTITVGITNQGDASTAVANACANGQITVNVYQNGYVKATWTIGDMEVGASASHSFTIYPDSSCAIHTYCAFAAKVDADDCITESDEANNSMGRASYRQR